MAEIKLMANKKGLLQKGLLQKGQRKRLTMNVLEKNELIKL